MISRLSIEGCGKLEVRKKKIRNKRTAWKDKRCMIQHENEKLICKHHAKCYYIDPMVEVIQLHYMLLNNNNSVLKGRAEASRKRG